MNDSRFLPMELQSVIGTEKIDFSVSAKRNRPAGPAISAIFFGAVWTAFTSIFVVAFFGPLFIGEESHFEVNGVPTVGSLENFQPMILPALLIGVFVLVGVGILSWGFYSLYQKGGHFVGTASRLLHYYKGKISSYNWEHFTGNMEIEIDNRKGNISLQLRYGNIKSRKNRSNEFVPEVVYVLGIPNVLEIEKICRKRIKENDPTPANITKNE